MKVECFSIKRQLTGHNDNCVSIYSFRPQLTFEYPHPRNGLVSEISIQSEDDKLYQLGVVYNLDLKAARRRGE